MPELPCKKSDYPEAATIIVRKPAVPMRRLNVEGGTETPSQPSWGLAVSSESSRG